MISRYFTLLKDIFMRQALWQASKATATPQLVGVQYFGDSLGRERREKLYSKTAAIRLKFRCRGAH
jgi:hypothetical protein